MQYGVFCKKSLYLGADFDYPMNEVLDIHDIQKGVSNGITPAKGMFLHENCVVCLDRNLHISPTAISVAGISVSPLDLHWSTIVTDEMRRAYADKEETTEYGAECVAALMALKLTEFTVIGRACKKTGVDYYLGNKGDLLFQNAARLEVSGILKGDRSKVATRVKQKLKQTDQSGGEGALPAYVCVVEFSEPHVVFETR